MKETGLEGGKFTIGLMALDFDGDGLPDVYIGNYLDTDSVRESKAPATSFMTPDEYKGQDNQMLRNLGGWKFADVTDASGTRDPGSKTIGAVALDYDGDGKTDFYVANDQWRNTLFHNEGGGVFRDVSDETGTGYPEEGSVTAFGRRTRSGMGLVAADFDGDGRPDLYVTNYANEPNTLYRNVEGATYAESEREAFGGDHDPVLPLSKWGTVGLDFDNDGKDDLAVSSGQILSRFYTVLGGWFNPKAKNFAVGEKSYAQRQFLFHNESAPGTMTFRDVSAESGDLGRLVIVGRGLSAGRPRRRRPGRPRLQPDRRRRDRPEEHRARRERAGDPPGRGRGQEDRPRDARDGRDEGEGVLRDAVVRERLVAAAPLRPRGGRVRARDRDSGPTARRRTSGTSRRARGSSGRARRSSLCGRGERRARGGSSDEDRLARRVAHERRREQVRVLALLGLHLAVELPLGRAGLEVPPALEEEVPGAPLEVDGELQEVLAGLASCGRRPRRRRRARPRGPAPPCRARARGTGARASPCGRAP